jgi:hypothetical protein
MDGWVKLFRQSIDSEVFADSILFKLWCMCLMLASHKEQFILVDGIGRPIKIMPGQFITGIYSLHKKYYRRKKKSNISPSTLWRKLQILQNMQNLQIKSYNKYSIITIVKWEEYQQNEKQLQNNCKTTAKQLHTYKNDKKEKNIYTAKNEKIYAYYLKKINPFRKSKQRALKNIGKVFNKNICENDLIFAIDNYSINLNPDPKYRFDPANFFGRKEVYIDFLPGNFEPPPQKRNVIN